MTSQSPHTLLLRFDALTLRGIVAALFLLNFVLLLFAWHRVFVPSMLAEGKPPAAPLRDVILVVGFPASVNERSPAGTVKVSAIRKGATDFIDRLPAQMRLAVVLYGHRRDNECGAEVVRKLAELDDGSKTALKKLLAEVNPVGLAPLADALKLAGEELARQATGGGIVVMADGVDTCDGDAAAQVSSLGKRLDLKHGVQVLGFSVIPKDIRPLRRVAEVGKGKFFDNQTGAELDQAITDILDETRTTVEHDYIASSLANTTHSGWQTAFGADPVAASFLALLYCLLVTLGAFGAVGGLVLQITGRLATIPGGTFALTAALAIIAAAAWLLLALQMLIGFPIESEFHRHAFTYRSSWLLLTLIVNFMTLLAAGLAFWLVRNPDKPTPEVRIEW